MCRPCSPGSAQPEAGETMCPLCSAGRFSSESNSTECTACPRNTFAPHRGMTTCTRCGAVEFTAAGEAGTGQRACDQCAPGQYVVWKNEDEGDDRVRATPRGMEVLDAVITALDAGLSG